MIFHAYFKGGKRSAFFEGGCQRIPHLGGGTVERGFSHVCVKGGWYQISVLTPSSVVTVVVAYFLGSRGVVYAGAASIFR